MKRLLKLLQRRLWLQRMLDDAHRELRITRSQIAIIGADRDRVRRERDEARRDLSSLLDQQVNR